MKTTGERRSGASVSGGSYFQDSGPTPELALPTTYQRRSTSDTNINALSVAERSYFQDRLKNRLYDLIIELFMQREADGFTKAELARVLDKRPEQVSRLLANPGNWTLDTISDLLLGICKAELELGVSYPFEKKRVPEKRPTWLEKKAKGIQSQVYISYYEGHNYFSVDTAPDRHIAGHINSTSLNVTITEQKDG